MIDYPYTPIVIPIHPFNKSIFNVSFENAHITAEMMEIRK